MKFNERQACQVLGLAAPTTLAAARKAYRKLAREHHPDHGGQEERFKQISVAYQYLVDYYQEAPGHSTSKETERNKAQGQAQNQKKAQTSESTQSKSESQERQKNTRSKQQKKHSQASSTQAHSEADHRKAWRDWREQVDRHNEKQAKHSTQKESSKKESTQDESQAKASQHTHEVVEAAVVPTFGDTVKRWSEDVGDKIAEVSDHLGHKFNQWYRKSARSLFEKGSDEKLKLILDLNTVLYGKQLRIAIQRNIACPSCQYESGHLRQDPNIPAAQWADGCKQCLGQGRISSREELSVYVPPGANKGHKLKVNGKGSEGLNGAEPGDLFLILTPEELPKGFRRNGADLELHQAVSESLLIRGGVLPIQSLRGTLNVKIPPNFQPGKKLLIPSQGLPLWGEPEQIGKLTLKLSIR